MADKSKKSLYVYGVVTANLRNKGGTSWLFMLCIDNLGARCLGCAHVSKLYAMVE